MASGDFLKSFSRGIYDELNEGQRLQTERDTQQQGALIQMLAGLADKVEPESLPTLMGHIWDTMGIKKKGKTGTGLRGFLDAFSGMPDRSMEDQLGSKFRELTQGMVGPQTAKDIRLRGNISQKGIPGYVQAAPTSEYGQKAAADVQGLGKKLVFRDPYQQRIEEIEAKSAANLQNQLFMQQQRNDAAAKLKDIEFEHRRRLEQEEYDRKANLGIDQVARVFAGSQEVKSLPPQFQEAAAWNLAQRYLSGKYDAQVQDIFSRIDLRSILGQSKIAEIKAGGSPAARMAERRFSAQQLKTKQGYESEISKAQAIIDTLDPDLAQQEARLDKVAPMAGGYKTREELLKAPESLFLNPLLKDIQDYKKKLSQRNAAKAAIETNKKHLEEFLQTGKVSGTTKKAAVPPPAAQKRSGLVPRMAPFPTPQAPGGNTYDATTPGISPGRAMNQKVYKIPEANLERTLHTLKGNWVVGETITEDGIRKVIIRLQE